MKTQVTILKGEPTIEVLAEQSLDWDGVRGMASWVKTHRPECLPDDYDPDRPESLRCDESWPPDDKVLFPHEMKPEVEREIRPGEYQWLLTDNELLVELAGRKCYDSFGLKAGKKTNAEYIANTQAGDVPHASILYHAKMTFFIAGISRRVSHELIRNYVGADRDEEGAPSQESTRFTHHYGYYVAPPRILPTSYPETEDTGWAIAELAAFEEAMRANYNAYLAFIQRQFAREPGGDAKGMARKRIYEAASAYLSHACETSFVWTTNPMALRKLFKERAHPAADLEFFRFASKWKRLCIERWPNLFAEVAK